MDLLPELFEPGFAQRALLATIVVALAGGVLGAWIVLHDLAFFAHAGAAGAYPLVVLAPAGAVATEAFSFAGALLFAAAFFFLARRTGERDLAAGLLLTGFLAAGALLQHVRGSERSAEALFFGSVLTVDDAALTTLSLAAAAALAIAFLSASRWTAAAFDNRFDGRRAAALVVAIALLVAAAMPTLGALLVAALAVVPAATARLFRQSLRSLVVSSVSIALVTGVGGLWLALQLDLAPGATIAALGFGIFALAALWQAAPVRHARPAIACIAAAVLLTGCGSEKSSEAETPVVVASTPVIGDLARQVAGSGLRVETLLEPGADPHHYEPRPSDLATLADARVVLRSGGEIDAWLPEAIEASDNGRRAVDLSSSAVLRERDGVINPHWFLDPPNVVTALERLRIEFTKAAPERRETYRANAHRVAAAYRRLDRWARACFEQLPAGRRAIVTGHNAFDYMAARYGIAVPARISSGNAHSEPSAEAVAKTVRVIRDQDIPVIAVVASESDGVAAEIARDSGAELVELHGDTLPDRSSSLLDVLYEDVERLTAAMGRRCERER